MGIIPLSTDGACPCLIISSCSNFTVSLPQLSSSNVSSNRRQAQHAQNWQQQRSKSRHRSLQWAEQETVSAVHGLLQVQAYCRLQCACTWNTPTGLSTAGMCVILTSCGVYCVQDLALNRPWQNFALVRFDYCATFQPITAVTANLHVYEHVTPCHWVSSCRRFEWSYFLHLEIPANPLQLFDITIFRSVGNQTHCESASRRLQWHRCDNLQCRLSFYSVITLRTGSFKLFKRPFPRVLTILTL
jgi:hypothetical protein